MSDHGTVSFDIHVGCLNYAMMRSKFRSLAWRGFQVEWIEGSEWLSRDFTIRCDPACKQELAKWFEQISERA